MTNGVCERVFPLAVHAVLSKKNPEKYQTVKYYGVWYEITKDPSRDGTLAFFVKKCTILNKFNLPPVLELSRVGLRVKTYFNLIKKRGHNEKFIWSKYG